jgi:hypothetical protein
MTTMAMTTMVREYRVERRRGCDSANKRDNETETEGRKRERVRENSMVINVPATMAHKRQWRQWQDKRFLILLLFHNINNDYKIILILYY